MESNKIVFLGDSSVGKTSIINSFYRDIFIEEQSPTIGAFVTTKKVSLDDGKEITLSIWDTAGQERYRALAPMYFRDANVAVLVYAINSRDSFDKLQEWIDNIKKNTRIMPHLIIVGNKKDLSSQRAVPLDEALKFAGSSNATFFECSAKLNDGINEMFDTAANLMSKTPKKIENQTIQVPSPKENENQNNSTKKCC